MPVPADTKVPINAQVPPIKVELRHILIKAPMYSIHFPHVYSFVTISKSIIRILDTHSVRSMYRRTKRESLWYNQEKRAKKPRKFPLEIIKRVFSPPDRWCLKCKTDFPWSLRMYVHICMHASREYLCLSSSCARDVQELLKSCAAWILSAFLTFYPADKTAGRVLS
jgi:hypothetical protein